KARAPAGSVTQPAARVGWSSPRGWLQQQLPRLVLSPTVLITFVFVYGFILWTLYLSFTRSRGIPSHELVGWLNYQRVWNHPRWSVALHNLAVFGILYIALCLVLGLSIAILLDQRIRQEGALRAIYLYPPRRATCVSRSPGVPRAYRASRACCPACALAGGSPPGPAEPPFRSVAPSLPHRAAVAWGPTRPTRVAIAGRCGSESAAAC